MIKFFCIAHCFVNFSIIIKQCLTDIDIIVLMRRKKCQNFIMPNRRINLYDANMSMHSTALDHPPIMSSSHFTAFAYKLLISRYRDSFSNLTVQYKELFRNKPQMILKIIKTDYRFEHNYGVGGLS